MSRGSSELRVTFACLFHDLGLFLVQFANGRRKSFFLTNEATEKVESGLHNRANDSLCLHCAQLWSIVF